MVIELMCCCVVNCGWIECGYICFDVFEWMIFFGLFGCILWYILKR